jgi:hypothetical protein
MQPSRLISVGCDIAIGLTSAWFAPWLFIDAFTFGLQGADPATGRVKGCYTALDLWLGHLSPADWTRNVERVGSLFLFALCAYCAWRLICMLRARWQPSAV